MANRLLGREVLALIGFVKKETEILSKVHITRDFAEATDGRILLRVPLQEDTEKEFPSVGDIDLNDEDILVPAESLKKVFANAPKNAVLPILSKVLIGRKNGKVVLVSTDLENESRIEIAMSDDNFADTDKVMEFPEGGLKICISVELLEKVVDFVRKSNKKKADSIQKINFTFHGSNEPVRIQIPLEQGEATGVLMPIKLEESEIEGQETEQEEIKIQEEAKQENAAERAGQEKGYEKEEVKC